MVTKSLNATLETMADLDLEHRLVNYLHARHVPGFESLRFDVRNGRVAVSGQLRSARSKWLCVECCRRVAGVVKLVDELSVDNR